MALVPFIAKAGNRVCMRGKEERKGYLLVGNAYAHGIMAGEALAFEVVCPRLRSCWSRPIPTSFFMVSHPKHLKTRWIITFVISIYTYISHYQPPMICKKTSVCRLGWCYQSQEVESRPPFSSQGEARTFPALDLPCLKRLPRHLAGTVPSLWMWRWRKWRLVNSSTCQWPGPFLDLDSFGTGDFHVAIAVDFGQGDLDDGFSCEEKHERLDKQLATCGCSRYPARRG